VEPVEAKEAGVGSGIVGDACKGNCNEDTEKRCDTGFPYMLDTDPEGLVYGFVLWGLEASSGGGVGSPNDVFAAVEVGNRLDTEVEWGRNIIDEDGRRLCCAAVGWLELPGGS
jgi:hypothetical protein